MNVKVELSEYELAIRKDRKIVGLRIDMGNLVTRRIEMDIEGETGDSLSISFKYAVTSEGSGIAFGIRLETDDGQITGLLPFIRSAAVSQGDVLQGFLSGRFTAD
jgi:hypothetical protein